MLVKKLADEKPQLIKGKVIFYKFSVQSVELFCSQDARIHILVAFSHHLLCH